MKHQENCQLQICIDGGHRHPHMPCTCTPIESPKEKCDCPTKYCKHFESDFDKFCKENPHCNECEKAMRSECKGTCEVEGGWEEKLENLKCINGAMYFGAKEEPCYGRETGECCYNEQTYEEALAELKSFLRSELAKARQEGKEEALKEIEKGRDDDSCECDNCIRFIRLMQKFRRQRSIIR